MSTPAWYQHHTLCQYRTPHSSIGDVSTGHAQHRTLAQSRHRTAHSLSPYLRQPVLTLWPWLFLLFRHVPVHLLDLEHARFRELEEAHRGGRVDPEAVTSGGGCNRCANTLE
eukprot:425353-Rhodomonas_salina.2